MKTKYQFKDTPFIPAVNKQRVLRDWQRFVTRGLSFKQFTKALYQHLISHCSFIAHYDRVSFYEYYFTNPTVTLRFLRQFDRSEGCLSIECGGSGWLTFGDYSDLNQAMVDVLAASLPDIRAKVRERQISIARTDLGLAEQRLAEALAQG